MGNDLEVKLNWDGVGTLLRSNEMKTECLRQASIIQKKCGDGYETGSFMGTDRVKATVFADSIKARNSNLKNNTLLKALK